MTKHARLHRKRTILITVASILVAVEVAYLLMVRTTAGEPETDLKVSTNGASAPDAGVDGAVVGASDTLRLLTLNAAHGRQEGPNQVFQKGTTIESNLEAIAAVLEREQPDVLALQEADGPSIWSGKLDHVDYLAEKAGYPYATRGEHVKGMNVSYGTALLSKLPMHDARSYTFEPSPPTLAKGLVVITIGSPDNPDESIDVVSVHLDFSRKSVREKQVQEMIARLSKRERPLIVMGDFNCQWTDKGGALPTLAEALDLRVYEPERRDLNTFSKLKRRLDWILISRELEFVSYRVLPDALSDHRGVLCEVRRVPPSSRDPGK